MQKTFDLTRQKHKPGSAVQRFGDWRKGEPSVIIDNKRWNAYGNPENVIILICQDKVKDEH